MDYDVDVAHGPTRTTAVRTAVGGRPQGQLSTYEVFHRYQKAQECTSALNAVCINETFWLKYCALSVSLPLVKYLVLFFPGLNLTTSTSHTGDFPSPIAERVGVMHWNFSSNLPNSVL